MTSLSGFRNLATKIVCVGRNYKDHALELGNAIPKKPMLFVKTVNSFIVEGEPIVAPPGCQNLHQEVELGVVIAKKASNISKSDAMSYIGGYTVALDMTARDFQDEAKKSGAPWFLAKSFDGSCPVGGFLAASEIPNPHDVELFCKINGKDQQRSRTDVMIFDIPTLLEYATKFVTLEPGDVVLTGTPAGVTRINSGDVIEFGLTDKLTAKFTVQ
uniref:Oxaloacetate tautomerase FAHD1, mitochondrial n=1 Tax=Caenorhabditis japonica TaxID=281687 RepID=A0A8R1HSX5_CAEJA